LPPLLHGMHGDVIRHLREGRGEMTDLSTFGTPECALSIEAQLFRWQRQGGNDACADCGSVVAIDWCSISAAAAPAPSHASTSTAPAACADPQALTHSAAAAPAPASASVSVATDANHDPHRWAVTLCPACAGVHRAMGRQLCQVLSLTMDSWTLALVRRCVTFGPRYDLQHTLYHAFPRCCFLSRSLIPQCIFLF
jgi:hypothetical protein